MNKAISESLEARVWTRDSPLGRLGDCHQFWSVWKLSREQQEVVSPLQMSDSFLVRLWAGKIWVLKNLRLGKASAAR